MKVDRIPVNSTEREPPTTENIYLNWNKGNIGLITNKDTLLLVKPNWRNPRYNDILHNQDYSCKFVEGPKGILIQFTPIRPYTRKLYSITLTSL